MITQKRLKQLYNYNPDTGEFTRIAEATNKLRLGEVVTNKVCVDGCAYPAFRVAWLYMTGHYPSRVEITCLNGSKGDTKWSNLKAKADLHSDTLTHERLLQVVSYNPKTGQFSARLARNGVSCESTIGSTRRDGYVQLTIDRKRYLAHRLAWFYMMHEFPESILDHRDGNPSNNRWKNLRLADCSLNGMNTKPRKCGASRFKGVSINGKGWRVEITKNGVTKHLGTFPTEEEAALEYDKAAKKLFGEFARLNFATSDNQPISGESNENNQS